MKKPLSPQKYSNSEVKQTSPQKPDWRLQKLRTKEKLLTAKLQKVKDQIQNQLHQKEICCVSEHLEHIQIK